MSERVPARPTARVEWLAALGDGDEVFVAHRIKLVAREALYEDIEKGFVLRSRPDKMRYAPDDAHETHVIIECEMQGELKFSRETGVQTYLEVTRKRYTSKVLGSEWREGTMYLLEPTDVTRQQYEDEQTRGRLLELVHRMFEQKGHLIALDALTAIAAQLGMSPDTQLPPTPVSALGSSQHRTREQHRLERERQERELDRHLRTS